MAKNKVLNITEIEDGIKRLVTNLDFDNFIINFLAFYDIPKTSITRAKKQFEEGKDFSIKNKFLFREVETDVVLTIDSMEQEIAEQKSKPRFIMATDFEQVAVIDTQTRATLNISIEELPANADFFLAWNGIEKADYQAENPADRKAAERFAKLYDVIANDNPTTNEHAFNLFLIRVLFLLFAEDTGIISKGSFTNALKTRTQEDGRDFNDVITELFEILDIPTLKREGKANWLQEFPYVNGKLFGEPHVPLHFTKVSRELLIEAGELLNWKEINPDILGSMIQTVASAEDRHLSGMHYTSVPNIMKVIKPLFLEELDNVFNKINDKYFNNQNKDITEKTRKENERHFIKELHVLLDRISKIKFLDPACGSGNFLIITYKELRRLEIKILLLAQQIEQIDIMPISVINLSQFNGIELDDFAHEVAKLSLWIAEHQMNEQMIAAIPGSIAQLLPLKDAGNIVQGNSLRINWNKIVPHDKDNEVYIMGNPPYIGAKKQTKGQKKDLEYALDGNDKYKKLDYISGWLYLGAKFISRSRAALAFVTTNSITQGEQVSMLWPSILENAQIFFAHSSFKWSNSAKHNAGVTVSIIGLNSKDASNDKYLFVEDTKKIVRNITPYLTEGGDTIVTSRTDTISGFPKAFLGSLPLDGGNFIFSIEEYKETLTKFPELSPFLKKYVGSAELINQQDRFVLWLKEDSYQKHIQNPIVNQRVEAVKKFRKTGGQSAQGAVDTSFEFFTKNSRENAINLHHKNSTDEMITIIVPRVSSENRKYVPMGIVGEDTVVSDSATAIYNAPIWLLGLLESRMHMTWLRSVGGKLETRYRYSAGLVYNTFPVKELSTQRKNEMARVMLEILDLREYEGGTLAQLYNKDTMPESLRRKHEELDGIVDRAYQQKQYESDEERLATLLKLYKEMIK